MDNTKFCKKIEKIIYYITKYGLDHMEGNINEFPSNPLIVKEFYSKVHKGFYYAQDQVLELLPSIIYEKKDLKNKIKLARKNRDKKDELSLQKTLQTVTFQEVVLRKTMDSIAWQFLQFEPAYARRLYCNEQPIDITDSNLESELIFIEHYKKENPDGFALISDLTSFVQISDIITSNYGDPVQFIELKEGKINKKVFEIVQEAIKNPCPQYINQKLEKENPKFKEHFIRTAKQVIKNYTVVNTIKTGKGTDIATNCNVILHDAISSPNSFSSKIFELSEKCNEKGYAITTIEDCLMIGIYDTEKFPSFVFDYWMKLLNFNDKIYNLRSSFYNPTAFPIFLFGFPNKFIIDLIAGKRVVKMALDIDKWLKKLEKVGASYRLLSPKETKRIEQEDKGKIILLRKDNRFIEIKYKSQSILLGGGLLSKIFTHFFTPNSICDELLEILKKT